MKNEQRPNGRDSGSRLAYLLAAVVMMWLGLVVMLPNLSLYWHYQDVGRQLDEAAEQQGLAEIPGADVTSEMRTALVFAVVGGMLLTAGAALLLFAILLRLRGRIAGFRS